MEQRRLVIQYTEPCNTTKHESQYTTIQWALDDSRMRCYVKCEALNQKQYNTIYNEIQHKMCYNVLQYTMLYNIHLSQCVTIHNRVQYTIRYNNVTMYYNIRYNTQWILLIHYIHNDYYEQRHTIPHNTATMPAIMR